jgi:transcriptional regulator with XRE-family HTH domain
VAVESPNPPTDQLKKPSSLSKARLSHAVGVLSRHRSKKRAKEPGFAEVICNGRRELDLTQTEVASRIKASTSYVGKLESGKRHPSNMIVTRLAKALRLDKRELFFLANLSAAARLSAQSEGVEVSASVWDQFRKDKKLRHHHDVSKVEMKMLSKAIVFGCDLGRAQSLRDLIYMLNTIRHAVGK